MINLAQNNGQSVNKTYVDLMNEVIEKPRAPWESVRRDLFNSKSFTFFFYGRVFKKLEKLGTICAHFRGKKNHA